MSRDLSTWTVVFALCLGLWAGRSACALVVTAANDGRYLVAPDDDPGWNNMGILGGGSAVYLGNNWILTANHVSGSSVRFTDGSTFSVSQSSAVRLSNSGGAQPDLRMVRLIGEVNLPAITIADEPPTLGNSVVLMGAGRGKLPGVTYWSIDAAQKWAESSYLKADAIGFKLDSSSPNVMRWGANKVANNNQSFNNTVAFSTDFSQYALESEAQGVLGDSGGGAFIKDGDSWKLAGIIMAETTLPGQERDKDKAAYGQRTIVAQLSNYHSQIIETLAPSPWQNQLNKLDVDRTGTITIRDALIVKNALLRLEAGDDGSLAGGPADDDFLYDVDGDRKLGTLDLLRIRNQLLGVTTATAQATALAISTAGLTEGELVVPEPAGWSLALAAMMALGFVASARKRRGSHGFVTPTSSADSWPPGCSACSA